MADEDLNCELYEKISTYIFYTSKYTYIGISTPILIYYEYVFEVQNLTQVTTV